MHPSNDVLEINLSYGHKDRMNNLLFIGCCEKVVNRVRCVVITFRQNTQKNITLYFCLKFAKIITEGPEAHFFLLEGQPLCSTADTTGAAGATEENNNE